MFTTTITPRIGDTDGLRHINNNVVPIWFETARNPIFRIFVPNLELTYKKWNLILAHTETNYIKQIYFGYDVEIRTYVSRIGNSSFTIIQEVWQNGQLRCSGLATMVHFNFIKQKSERIPDDVRKELEKHLITEKELKIKNNKEMKENKKHIEEFDYIESDM